MSFSGIVFSFKVSWAFVSAQTLLIICKQKNILFFVVIIELCSIKMCEYVIPAKCLLMPGISVNSTSTIPTLIFHKILLTSKRNSLCHCCVASTPHMIEVFSTFWLRENWGKSSP